eukprot:scaffold696_cov421-Pavlova_lutheri.AAC.1
MPIRPLYGAVSDMWKSCCTIAFSSVCGGLNAGRFRVCSGNRAEVETEEFIQQVAGLVHPYVGRFRRVCLYPVTDRFLREVAIISQQISTNGDGWFHPAIWWQAGWR